MRFRIHFTSSNQCYIMAYIESWKKLTFLNKCLFVLTFVATLTLVLGIATPFWLTVSVPDDFAAKVYIKPSKLQIDLLETNHYLGLWQWCFGGNGCIDLGLIAKFGSEKKYQYQWEKDWYEKAKKIIGKVNRIFAFTLFKDKKSEMGNACNTHKGPI